MAFKTKNQPYKCLKYQTNIDRVIFFEVIAII